MAVIDIEQHFKNCDIDLSKVKLVEARRTIRFTPKTQKDKKKVLEGNYPDDLNLFVHYIAVIGHVVDRPRWFYDPKNPYVEFDIIERL